MYFDYKDENYRLFTGNKSDITPMIKMLTRERHVRTISMKELTFTSPLCVRISNGKEIRITKTALELIRKRLKIPFSYVKEISTDLLKTNLNRRIQEMNNSVIDIVFSSEKMDCIDGFVSPRFAYIPDIFFLQKSRYINSDNVKISVKRITGLTVFDFIIIDQQADIIKGDPVKPGFTIINPWVMEHPFVIRQTLERVICSNGMKSIGIEAELSFSFSTSKEIVLNGFNKFLINQRYLPDETNTFRRMSNVSIEKEVRPNIRKFYKGRLKKIEQFEGANFWDLYNFITEFARDQKGLHSLETLNLASALARLFVADNSDDLLTEKLWEYFKII